MRIKTIVIILITILLTVVIMENTGKVKFTILFGDFYISKLFVMLVVGIVAFILGWLVGRPKRVIKLAGDDTETGSEKNKPGTLSDEDRDYIS
jgi:uncharacterized integral membrane protein